MQFEIYGSGISARGERIELNDDKSETKHVSNPNIRLAEKEWRNEIIIHCYRVKV